MPKHKESLTKKDNEKMTPENEHGHDMRRAACDSAYESTRKWCNGEIDTHKHKENIRRVKKSLAEADQEAGPAMRSMRR